MHTNQYNGLKINSQMLSTGSQPSHPVNTHQSTKENIPPIDRATSNIIEDETVMLSTTLGSTSENSFINREPNILNHELPEQTNILNHELPEQTNISFHNNIVFNIDSNFYLSNDPAYKLFSDDLLVSGINALNDEFRIDFFNTGKSFNQIFN